MFWFPLVWLWISTPNFSNTLLSTMERSVLIQNGHLANFVSTSFQISHAHSLCHCREAYLFSWLKVKLCVYIYDLFWLWNITPTSYFLRLHGLHCDKGLAKIVKDVSRPHRQAEISPVKVKDTHLMNNICHFNFIVSRPH